MTTFLQNKHIKRALIIAALIIAGGASLLLVCLAFLPALIGSRAVQARMQHALSFSLKRQVAWSDLAMSWSGGLTLSGLKLGDGPAPLLKTDIDQVIIVPAAGRGADGRFGIDLTVRIRNVRVELAPAPPKPPLPSPKDPLTQLAESIQRIQGLDVPLPVDLRVFVEVAPLQVVYRAAPGKLLILNDFSFRCAMPSLASQPVIAEMNGRMSLDGREMGKVGFNAKVSDLVTKERRIHLASALFAVDGTAPGTSIALTGGLSQADGFAARWKLNLPGLLAVGHPLIPPAVPNLNGNVELLLRAKTDTKRDLHATLIIDGTGLEADGGALKARRFGPLDIRLHQQIVTDHLRQRVEFADGTLAIPGLIDAAWHASVNRPSVPERSVDVVFGPLRLDLGRAISLAAPFLPASSPVKVLTGDVSLRSLSLHLAGPGNNGDLALAGFATTLSHVRLALENSELTAEDTSLFLERGACPLSGVLPTKLTADLLMSIRRGELSGAKPLIIQGARGTVGVAVTDLNLKSASPRKVAASVTLSQSLDLDRASSGTRFSIEKLHEQLRFMVRAAENGYLEATLPEFAVTAASFQGVQSGKRFGPIPLSASVTASGLHLPAGTGGRPSLQHAAATISAGDFLLLAADAALSGGAPQRATASGTARIDLRRALLFAAPLLPSGIRADGTVTAVWDLAAPLPEKDPAATANPLRSVRAGLSLFDTLEFGLKLDNITATVPSAKGTIVVSGLHTRPDLRVVSTRKGDSVRIDGGVRFAGLSGLPGTAGKLPSQHGSFAFNGELLGWKMFHGHEEVRIDPLAVSHEAELNVNRIDALLEEKEPFGTGTMIKRLDATLFANVDAAFSHDMKPLLAGCDVSGTVSSGVRVDLVAGHELAVRATLKTTDFGIQFVNGTKVEGVRSDIAINRVYSLAAASSGDIWTPLSSALVRPSADMTANPGAAVIAGRIHDDLRGAVRGTRSFRIRRVTATVSGVPLELTALEGDLLLTLERAGLGYFQADLLGGTILASGMFDLRPEVPVITAADSFSNLDISYLLPKEARTRHADQDAEITGEMSLSVPLTADQRELFEQLRLAINLRKIGASTIERALFSLDPYEQNEQVVAQRKMLRLGSLKGLRATAVDGAFSMEGEARIKGVAVDLPKVERLRISELPLRQELVKNREGIAALRGLLDLVRADTLIVGPHGELSLKRRMYEQ